MTTPVRIPADVDREDRLIGTLTARQLAILAATGAILFAIWTFAARVLPGWSPAWAAASPGVRLTGFAVAAIPIAVAGLALALGRRDGMPLDRLLLAAAGQRLALPTDRHRTHPTGTAPRDAAGRGEAADSDVASTHARAGRWVVARVPARDVRASITRPDVGVVELGRDGLALVCAVTPVNLMLRSPSEQDQLVAGMARWLHSLTQPVQVLVRTTPLDLTGHIDELRAQAARRPHPALAAAGNAHADHLTDLAHHTDLLRRRIYLVFHQPVPARQPHPNRKPSDRGRADRIRRAVRAAEDQLLRRADEADQLLGSIGARVTLLDPAATTHTLLAATNPDQHLHPPLPTTATHHGHSPRAHETRNASAAPTNLFTHLQPPSNHPPGSQRHQPHPPQRQPQRRQTPGRRRTGRALSWRHRARRQHTSPREMGPLDPRSLLVGPRYLRVGDAWVATLTITGYPRTVYPGWLSPLTHHPGLVDTSVHISPIDPEVAAARLHRQLGRLESGRRSIVEHGRLLDPHMEAATEDAHDLADRVARAEAHLYAVTITLTVHAATGAELDDEVTAIRSLAASLLIQLRPTTLRAVYGWWTGLPTGLNHLTTPATSGGVFSAGPEGRVMDTAALSYAFPLASPDLPTTNRAGGPAARTSERVPGVLYGHNLASAGSLVFWDRFGLDNYNSVVLGRSGSGKSYLIKLELLRQLYRGVQAHVIDPEAEFTRLATAVGGTIIRPGAAAVRLNPFDLPIHTHPTTGARTAAPDTLRRQELFLHTFLAVALGQPLTPDERAVLDTAITTTYRQAGITDDPATWTRRAPLLRDLHTTLRASADHTADYSTAPGAADGTGTARGTGGTDGPPDRDELGRGVDLRSVAASLATRLAPFVDGGAFSDLFGGPTTTPPAGQLVVWSLRELADELKPLAMLLVLDTIWRTVTHPHDRRPRLVTVDEAWMLLQNRAGAEFLLRMAKSSRKYWAGLTVATQDVADVLASDLGRAVITNAATQIVLRQAPQTIDQIVSVFSVSAGQRAFLLAADRGEGLLLAGQHQAAFAAHASPVEDELITTDPRQLAATRTAPEWIPLDTATATRSATGGPTPAREPW